MSRGQFILSNGTLKSANSLEITSENRSFRYGDGLFETIRAVNGKIPFWDFHIQRLKQGMEVMRIDAIHISWDYLRQQLEDLLKENEHTKGARIRLAVYRGGKGNYKPETNRAEYSAESFSLDNEKFKLNFKGKVLDVYTRIKKPLNILSMVKSANSLLYVLAAEHAKEKGFDESLIVNQKNELCETSSSNLFIIKGDRIYTPPLSSGCLPGIMRMVLISVLTKKGVKVIENSISPSDLIMAEEVFLTNSIEGISWVGGFQNKRYYKKYSEMFINDLNQLLS